MTYTFANLDDSKEYQVVLHFAEIYFDDLNSRIFNVAINGVDELSNYDILSEVPKFTAVIKTYNVTPQNGNIIIDMTAIVDNAKISAIKIFTTELDPEEPDPEEPDDHHNMKINAGELNSEYIDTTSNTWVTDTNYDGGNTYNVTDPIDGTDNDTLYQTERWGNTLNYTFSDLDDSIQYQIVLHFAEIWFDSQNSRIFNVSINGIDKLLNYDILTEVPKFSAVTKTYNVTPQNGEIVINMTATENNAKISAIEITEL